MDDEIWEAIVNEVQTDIHGDIGFAEFSKMMQGMLIEDEELVSSCEESEGDNKTEDEDEDQENV